MNLKKISVIALTLALAGGTLAGCSSSQSSSSGSTEAASEQKADVTMSYVSPADVKASLDANNDEYLIVDVRKAADYETSHVPTAIGVDMDAAKNGDYEAGATAMKDGLKAATGSETGGDAKIVLVCYTGNSYAQASTNVLSEIGADMDNVFTLEGGMKAWEADYAGDVESA